MSTLPTSPSGNAREMPETDLDSIGHHCDLAYCHQLDFLPFRCASCRGVYCLDHRTESAHQCARSAAAPAAASTTTTTTTSSSSSSAPQTKPTIHNTEQCSHLTCKTLIHTLTEPGVRCPECRREYCLKHRLKEGHACSPLPSRGGGGGGGKAGAGADTLKAMFARVRGTGKGPGDPAATTKKKKPVSRAMAVNALKRTAKGDASVPVERRVFLSVEAAASPTKSAAAAATGAAGAAATGAFWFDGKWKVGRVLDDAARRLGVENVNNRVAGEEDRLRVFHVDGGVFLEFGDTLGDKVVAGDTLVLLRGAGVIL
ncbi:hypothetical protein BO82DRAFT_336278 [Aspergillus uvarum CBS 121591]|uniref:AN1-type domain-containing protein n=1 Tax=Aspergillus uvarum CBS 121591 TaxID=1448315 RepID=A0A319CCN2_9EURO|nr:hypothetical protein BO82DRAFT_336278 [Aspergillus uvarum CBS 121591]PYH81461.1 hypothetical protein BO82DRAFT_336278 [Aspergillus uvarum CBS 121591]